MPKLLFVIAVLTIGILHSADTRAESGEDDGAPLDAATGHEGETRVDAEELDGGHELSEGDELEASGETEADAVTLDEVLRLAESRSPLVAVGNAEVEMAATRRFEAIWNRFPRFRADLSVAPAPRVELEVDPDTGELDPFSNRDSDRELLDSILGGAGLRVAGEISAIVPITTFGRIRLARQLADVGVEVAEIERDAAIAESRFEAFRAYRTIQWYREVDRILRDAEEALDSAEEELEWAIDDGDRTARTSLRQLTIARTDFVTLRGDADQVGLVARHVLALTLGLSPSFRAERLPEEFPEGEPPTLEEVLDVAREQRADYALLDQAVRAAELDQMSRMRQLTPDLFFAARLSGAYTPTVDDVSGPFVTDNYNRFGYGFLVGLRWNMNPATVVARARRAEANRDIAIAQRDAAWVGIEYEITEAYHAALSKRAILLSYRDALRSSEAWLNQAQFQYDQGLADYQDLKDPLETYYETAGGYYEAILRYELAVADLAIKSGWDELTAWPTATE